MADFHSCAARNCKAEIPTSLLMCGRHWRMVPQDVQRRVWATYRRGQESDGKPISRAYALAARAAVEAVAQKEQPKAPEQAQPGLFDQGGAL